MIHWFWIIVSFFAGWTALGLLWLLGELRGAAEKNQQQITRNHRKLIRMHPDKLKRKVQKKEYKN